MLGQSALLAGHGRRAAPPPFSSPVYASTLIGPGAGRHVPGRRHLQLHRRPELHAASLRLLLLRPRRRQLPAAGGQPGQPHASTGRSAASRATTLWRPARPPGSLPVQFSDARAVGYDSATGDVYVADTANNRVLVFSFSPTSGFSYLTQFGSKGTGNGAVQPGLRGRRRPGQPVGLRHRRHARPDREVLDRERLGAHLHAT